MVSEALYVRINIIQTTGNEEDQRDYYTSSTPYLAARARTSAQETTPGHAFSRSALIASTTSYPRAEFRFGAASFSLLLPSSRMDPSHPPLQRVHAVQPSQVPFFSDHECIKVQA